MSHQIDRPIFIIGTGRSGTIMFFNLLHVHVEMAWRLPPHFCPLNGGMDGMGEPVTLGGKTKVTSRDTEF